MLTKDAVSFFNGKSKLAAALGVSPAAISQWGEVVPHLRQFQLQALSGGTLMAVEKNHRDNGVSKATAASKEDGRPNKPSSAIQTQRLRVA